MNGRFIKPVIGKFYENKSGGTFKCIGYEPDTEEPIMENINTNCILIVHNVWEYSDGTIGWGHSTGGCFKENTYQ